ncbi:efflux RND transporter periplasmic adaptor subunit [Terasakiella pusilla]|uniref:efflux RND transporter periplasmic adaptor subunit n=1 Tax=Terasakiella pusilla TaxID=64973 RepID=UPI003AA84347
MNKIKVFLGTCVAVTLGFFVPELQAVKAESTSTAAEIRVQLTPVRQTTLSSGLSAKVMKLNLREGDRFKKGETLVTFDCHIYKAQLNRAIAAEKGAQKKLEVARRLEQLGSISQLDFAQSEVAQAMAQADIDMQRSFLRECVVKAPFAGRIAERRVKRWEYVPEGKELLVLYDDSAYELEMIIPSRWLLWVKPDLPFSIHLDETGRDYAAKIERIGSVIDPLNQSVKVYGVLLDDTSQLLPGMSGAATLVRKGEP